MHDPNVPETLEGWSVLHEMYRLEWSRLRALAAATRREIADEAAAATAGPDPPSGATALVRLLGHKGDLMFIHFRRRFDDLSDASLRLSKTRLRDYMTPSTSYVSIVELGMYEMTAKIHHDLASRSLLPSSDEHTHAFQEEMNRQRERVASRLFPELPRRRHVCFYPMNKRRGEDKNWYTRPFDDRAAMMREHGVVGRRYAGQVTQIISGSIGFDDWEWGVDLFADDPVVFKKLIYEMRFDRASAVYAEFGPFHVGLQFSSSDLWRLLEGETPELT
jgi:chlorite dismutase